MINKDIKFAFFGSSHLSIVVLHELEKQELIPAIIVTTPDKAKERNLKVSPNLVKDYAISKGIPYLDKAKLDDTFLAEYKDFISKDKIRVAIVASYGKIIPKSAISATEKGMLNIHPSLLPQYRGPSPLQTAILDDCKDSGVTIMQVDEQMDHGPIVAQEKVSVQEWPSYEEYEAMMAIAGTRLLANILPDYLDGKIIPSEQEHDKASFTRKFNKEDGLLDMNDDPYQNYLKIQAFHEWPQAYFMIKKNSKELRVKVTKANFANGKLEIQNVIPEGKKEMDYPSFLRGYKI